MVSAEGLKAKIRRGETTIGVGLPMTVSAHDFEAALSSGNGDYEFVFVDGQHSPFSERALVDFCQLASRFDLPVRLRIQHTRQTFLLGTYLDLGASGIEFTTTISIWLVYPLGRSIRWAGVFPPPVYSLGFV